MLDAAGRSGGLTVGHNGAAAGVQTRALQTQQSPARAATDLKSVAARGGHLAYCRRRVARGLQVSAAERVGQQQHPRSACFTICARTMLERTSICALIRARYELFWTPEAGGDAARRFLGARFVLALNVSRGQRTAWTSVICTCLGFWRRRASIESDVGPRIPPGGRLKCRESFAVALSATRARRANENQRRQRS